MNSNETDNPGLVNMTAVRAMLKSQYRAAFTMLKAAVELCPEDLWLDDSHKNRYWHLAYHAVFYTHLYAQTDDKAFTPWDKHRDKAEFLDEPSSEPYTREEILEYIGYCEGNLDGWIDALDLASPESGFWWYKLSKLEHQLVNLRHIQLNFKFFFFLFSLYFP